MTKAIIALTSLFALNATPLLAAGDATRLVGVWRYLREVDTRPDGSPAPTAASSDTQGLLIYTADGFMSVTLMPKGRKWSTDTATIAELRETVGNGTAYAGRYEVDRTAHTVTHTSSVNLEPDYQDKRLVRSYSFDGSSLQLSGTFPHQGETIRFVITWVRVTEVAPLVLSHIFLHPNGARRLTAMRVIAPSAESLPPSSSYLADHRLIKFEVGKGWLLDITLDGGKQGVTKDLEPDLPMVIHY
jgi:hypothetical protein